MSDQTSQLNNGHAEVEQGVKIHLSIFDRDNPYSLINIAPGCMANLMAKLAEDPPNKLLLGEAVLRSKLRPDDQDERLRLQFWNEYEMATSKNRKMSIQNVIRGVCDHETFLYYYLTKPHKYTWLLLAPTNYVVTLRRILNNTLEGLLEASKMPVFDKRGKPNVTAINQLIKIFQLVDLRVKGSIVQRVQVQQQNVNLNIDATDNPAVELSGMSLDELESASHHMEKIAALTGARDPKLSISLPKEGMVIDAEAEQAGPETGDPRQDSDFI